MSETVFSWTDLGSESKGLDTKKISELFDSLRSLCKQSGQRPISLVWTDFSPRLQVEMEGLVPNAPNALISATWRFKIYVCSEFTTKLFAFIITSCDAIQ